MSTFTQAFEALREVQSSKSKNTIEMTIRGTDKVVLLDEEDLSLVQKYTWRWSKHSKKPDKFGYVVTTARKPDGTHGTFSLHRLLMGNPAKHVDHINGDRLDNRRCNLRLASHQQNCFNVAKKCANPTSRYKGVSWNKLTSKWVSRIKSDGKTHQLGAFDDEAIAALIYDFAAIEIAEEFARTNFPRSILALIPNPNKESA